MQRRRRRSLAPDPDPAAAAAAAVAAVNAAGASAGPMSSQSILYDLFPPHVADALRAGTTVPPERKELMSMLFADVVGFTELSSSLDSDKVGGMLERLFDRLDSLAGRHGVTKLETIGDAYLCATNLAPGQVRAIPRRCWGCWSWSCGGGAGDAGPGPVVVVLGMLAVVVVVVVRRMVVVVVVRRMVVI